jgi:MFS family permease
LWRHYDVIRTPLRHRDFALLWTAGLVSITGDWMLLVAVPITVLALTGSSAATGAAVAAALVPRIVVAPIAGVFVDRWNRRRALVVANLLQVLFVLPLAAVNDAGDLWIVVGSTLAMGCVAQVVMTAENALLPTLVPIGETGRANSLNTLNNSLARLAGPAIGGVLAASAGIGTVAVTDAATFLVAAALIALVRARRPTGTGDADATRPTGTGDGDATRAGGAAGNGATDRARRRVWADLRTGLAVIRATRPLRVIFAFLAIISLGEGVMGVMIVVFAQRTLDGGPRDLGWIVSAQAIGGIAGGLLGGVIGDRVPVRWLIGLGTVALGAGDLLIFNYPHWYPELWPALVLMAAVGVPAALIMAGIMTVLQTSVADALRGRVFGAALTVMSLVGLGGTGLAAALGDRLGPVTLLNVQGVGLVAGGLFVIGALRPAVSGVTPATERTLMPAGRRG